MTETLVSYMDADTVDTIFRAAFIPEERWHGAAMPYFRFAEASRIAEECATDMFSNTEYRWHGGTFQEDVNTDSPEYVWQDVRTMPDPATGETLYEMGQGWEWIEVSPEEYPEVARAVDVKIAEFAAQGYTSYPRPEAR